MSASTPLEQLRSVAVGLTAQELRDAYEARWQLERQAAEHRIADLSELLWGPTLGAYRKNHQQPPWPADAPPPPPRKRTT